jgi:hypothetical protein
MDGRTLMLVAGWVPLLPEASSRWCGRTPEQGHEEGDDINTTLQAVAVAAAMRKRRKFVTVNMANRMGFAGESQVQSTLYVYTWRGAHMMASTRHGRN